MKARQTVMWVALVAAAWLAIAGRNAPTSDIAEPTKPARPADAGHSPKGAGEQIPRASKPAADDAILALQPRPAAVDANDDGRTAAMFGSKSWAPPPPPPPPPVATPQVTVPPMPFRFVGKQFADGRWTVFLTRDGATYRVRLGDVLDGTYRVEKIGPSELVLLYLPLKQEQALTIN